MIICCMINLIDIRNICITPAFEKEKGIRLSDDGRKMDVYSNFCVKVE